MSGDDAAETQGHERGHCESVANQSECFGGVVAVFSSEMQR
ncbi:hypothetical protein [Pectobacterium versatile]